MAQHDQHEAIRTAAIIALEAAPARVPMKVCYLAMPYRDPRGAWYVEQNIRAAEEIALHLWREGYAVICPHKNGAHFEGALPDECLLAGDLAILEKCDVLVLGPGWRESAGARQEYEHALSKGIPTRNPFVI